MFNLNENNRLFISNAPTDMRVGVNAMCGKVRPARLFPLDQPTGFREIRWDELVLFIEGISPNARLRKRFQASENKGENYAENKKNTASKIWLTR